MDSTELHENIHYHRSHFDKLSKNGFSDATQSVVVHLEALEGKTATENKRMYVYEYILHMIDRKGDLRKNGALSGSTREKPYTGHRS